MQTYDFIELISIGYVLVCGLLLPLDLVKRDHFGKAGYSDLSFLKTNIVLGAVAAGTLSAYRIFESVQKWLGD